MFAVIRIGTSCSYRNPNKLLTKIRGVATILSEYMGQETFVNLFEPQPQPRRKPAILPVGGGKGGVGKTCIAVNLAVTVANRGWRTVIVDADLSCANVEAVLGVQADARLDDLFLAKSTETDLAAYCTDTPYPNLRLLAGASGAGATSRPRPRQKATVFAGLERLDADLVIVDLDAGAHLTGADFFLLGRPHGLIVITPERTSIDNAFKFLRASLFRRIERFYGAPEVVSLLRRYDSLDGFLSALERLQRIPSDTRALLTEEILALARDFQPRLVVNKAQSAYEAKIAANILAKLTRNHLRFEAQSLGFLHFDSAVPEAVNSGTPFVTGRPRLPLSGCIGDMANRLGYF